MNCIIVNAASARHRMQIEYLAQFTRADRIEYRDLGKGEDYIITRGGEVFVLSIRSNRDQGGYLALSVPGMEPVVMS